MWGEGLTYKGAVLENHTHIQCSGRTKPEVRVSSKAFIKYFSFHRKRFYEISKLLKLHFKWFIIFFGDNRY